MGKYHWIPWPILWYSYTYLFQIFKRYITSQRWNDIGEVLDPSLQNASYLLLLSTLGWWGIMSSFGGCDYFVWGVVYICRFHSSLKVTTNYSSEWEIWFPFHSSAGVRPCIGQLSTTLLVRGTHRALRSNMDPLHCGIGHVCNKHDDYSLYKKFNNVIYHSLTAVWLRVHSGPQCSHVNNRNVLPEESPTTSACNKYYEPRGTYRYEKGILDCSLIKKALVYVS